MKFSKSLILIIAFMGTQANFLFCAGRANKSGIFIDFDYLIGFIDDMLPLRNFLINPTTGKLVENFDQKVDEWRGNLMEFLEEYHQGLMGNENSKRILIEKIKNEVKSFSMEFPFAVGQSKYMTLLSAQDKLINFIEQRPVALVRGASSLSKTTVTRGSAPVPTRKKPVVPSRSSSKQLKPVVPSRSSSKALAKNPSSSAEVIKLEEQILPMTGIRESEAVLQFKEVVGQLDSSWDMKYNQPVDEWTNKVALAINNMAKEGARDEVINQMLMVVEDGVREKYAEQEDSAIKLKNYIDSLTAKIDEIGKAEAK